MLSSKKVEICCWDSAEFQEILGDLADSSEILQILARFWGAANPLVCCSPFSISVQPLQIHVAEKNESQTLGNVFQSWNSHRKKKILALHSK